MNSSNQNVIVYDGATGLPVTDDTRLTDVLVRRDDVPAAIPPAAPASAPYAPRPQTTGGSNLMKASRQWATRPSDERYTSLTALHAATLAHRRASVPKVVSSRALEAQPASGDELAGIQVVGPNGAPVVPTHWAFGQLAQRAGAPAGYLRDLPAPLAADCINYGLKHAREVEDLGVLLRRTDGAATLAAVTGPTYGRVWNSDICAALVNRFGDGVNGHFRVPGIFGQRVEVTRENTTLYASDRDMFVFLADEDRRIEIPNRRNGEAGTLARGFFVWNSETGAGTLGIATFLFDYVCCNRIVWGARSYQEIRIRHSSGAPARWIDDVAPAIEAYSQSSAQGITALIEHARTQQIGMKVSRDDDVREFLAKRFTKPQAAAMMALHKTEEGRPIESLWDAATAATAYARGMSYQDARVDIEREAGKILDLAA